MPSRYLIGIDLGTTNSVVAYIDTRTDSQTGDLQVEDARVDALWAAEAGSRIRVFPVPQLVAHGEVRTLSTLPSFLYFPTADELSTGAVSATWDEDPPMVTGVLAREQGALVPSRQVSSAKSWLSCAGVDRRAKFLPVQAEPPQPMISPVEASARYLMHLRDAWNRSHGSDSETRFEHQEIVLTVPASFDEEARELTVEAARRAGFQRLTLLEEPLAAFYAWIAKKSQAKVGVREDELILICDIGGGTTDFSLVRGRSLDGELQFERTAVGEHILLGGDNLDFALARRVEEKLVEKSTNLKLTMRQRYALRRSCCAAKERLLSDSSAALSHVPVTVLGSGHAVVGQALSVELTREEVLQVLTEGFLPITAPNEMPDQGRLTGLRELGLPYASDPAITKHLAAFLTQAAAGMRDGSASPRASVQPSAQREMARPDAVLFNGGFCSPAVTRQRIIDAISAWFDGAQSGWRPKLLNDAEAEGEAGNAEERAVACGAAYYGRVRRGEGARVGAGSARSYYVGWQGDEGLEGICVLPAGAEEGTALPPLKREFSVLANRPVSFTLYSSRVRHDVHGVVTRLNGAEVHRHAPLVTLLRYGKKMRDIHLNVTLRADFTEVGTLELWCEARETPHRWRLQFELRGQEAREGASEAETPPVSILSSEPTLFDSSVEFATQLIRDVFAGASEDDAPEPDTLVSQMEAAMGAKKDSWPVAAIRRFCDVLIEVSEGRKASSRHEVRWLNLCGYCLRPGFGAEGDDARVRRVRSISSNELAFEDDLRCQVELLVLLRRIAGGINASEQQVLYRRYSGPGNRDRKRRVNRQLEYEQWRLLANLEHLPASTRARLGHKLLEKIRQEPEDAIWLWSLARLGSRIPLYGSRHSVVVPAIAGEWLKALLDLSTFTAAMSSAIAVIARRTDDRSRDIEDAIREQVVSWMTTRGVAEETVRAVSEYVSPTAVDAVRSFGESLPTGLELVSSSNCLLSLPALQGMGPRR